MFERINFQSARKEKLSMMGKAVNLQHYSKTDFHNMVSLVYLIRKSSVPLLQLRNKKHIKKLLIFYGFIISYLKDTLALLRKYKHKQFTKK